MFKKKHARTSTLTAFKCSLPTVSATDPAAKHQQIEKRRPSAVNLPPVIQTPSKPLHRRFPSTQLPALQLPAGPSNAGSLPKSRLPRSPAGTSLPSLSQGLTRVNSMALWSHKQPSSPTLPPPKPKPPSLVGRSHFSPKAILKSPKQPEFEDAVFKDHVVGGREIARDKFSNTERKDKDNRRIVEYLNSKFEAANKAFIDILEKHMVEILSDECLDQIANQNPKCVPEFRKALKHTLTQYLPSAVVLQKDSLKVKDGKFLSAMDEKPRETEMFSNFFKLDASNFHVDATLLQRFKAEHSTKRHFTVSRTTEASVGGASTARRLGELSRLPTMQVHGSPATSRRPQVKQGDAYNRPRLNVFKKLALLD